MALRFVKIVIPGSATSSEDMAVGNVGNSGVQATGRDGNHAAASEWQRGAADGAEAARMASAGKLKGRDCAFAGKPDELRGRCKQIGGVRRTRVLAAMGTMAQEKPIERAFDGVANFTAKA